MYRLLFLSHLFIVGTAIYIGGADELLDRSRRSQNVDFKAFLRLQLALERKERQSARELLDHRFVVRPFTEQQDIFATIQPLNEERLHTLVESLPQLDFTNDAKVSPLMYAVRSKNLEAVKIVVESKKADVNFRGAKGMTALFHAVDVVAIDIVKFLVSDEAGADVNAQDDHGETALFKAVYKKQIEIVKILVRCGVNISHKNSDNRTAIYWAIAKKNVEEAIFLLEKAHEDLNVWNGVYEWSYMQTAARLGCLPVLKHLVDVARDDLDMEDQEDQTALILATIKGHTDIVKFLIEAGADINKRDTGGESALFHAVSRKHLGIVKFLVDTGGVDITIRNVDDRTVMYFAITESTADLVKILVQKCTELKLTDEVEPYTTALYLAVNKGRKDIVEFLLSQKDSGINIKGGDGETPLFKAVHKNRLDIVRSMASRCKDLDANIMNNEYRTALHWAVAEGNLEMVRVLVKECKADVNIRCGKGNTKWTALQAACNMDWLDIVKFLVEEGGVKLDMRGNDGKRDVDKIIEDDSYPEMIRSYLESIK